MATARLVDLRFDLAYPSDHYKFLQRLGERKGTEILVEVFNKGVPYNIAGAKMGFEMRNDNMKVMIDTDQTRFTKVAPLEGVFSYKPPENITGFFGNAYLAYFTFENGADRVTTERFRFYNDEDVQQCVAPELQEHYVSVIDDLVASNQTAMDKAEEIKDLINANQVVKKSGDTMTGDLNFGGTSARQITSEAGTGKLVFGGSGVWITDSNGGGIPWQYRYSDRMFIVNASTNLARRTGDTFTGNIGFDLSNGGKLIRGENGGTARSGMLFEDVGFKGYDWQNNREVFRYTASSNTFNLASANTNLMYKADYTGKDGQVALSLSSEATNPDVNNITRSVRRGNTVTVHLCTILNANATGATVTNIPSDMRPIYNVSTYVPAHDGTATVQVFINASTGALAFSNNAKGKRIETIITYVVN